MLKLSILFEAKENKIRGWGEKGTVSIG